MFVKTYDSRLVNLLRVENISVVNSCVVAVFPAYTEKNKINIDGVRQMSIFQGTADECQKYMAELEKELAAFGKLVRVEVE